MKRTCTDRCLYARGKRFKCICGGELHGSRKGQQRFSENQEILELIECVRIDHDYDMRLVQEDNKR